MDSVEPKPEGVFTKWVFPSVLLAFSLLMLAGFGVLLAREMIQTNTAWREWRWRDHETQEVFTRLSEKR